MCESLEYCGSLEMDPFEGGISKIALSTCVSLAYRLLLVVSLD